MKKKLFIILLSVFSVTSFNQSFAQNDIAMIGEVKMFAGNFAPKGWMFCDGRILTVNSNPALFSILGTTYGGDGRTTFALPDLRGRVAMGAGSGPGLTNTYLGSQKGTETNTLTIQNLPAHNHEVQDQKMLPVDVVPANEPDAGKVTVVQTKGQVNQPTTIVGASQPVNNMQPSLSINYIICVQGSYPARE